MKHLMTIDHWPCQPPPQLARRIILRCGFFMALLLLLLAAKPILAASSQAPAGPEPSKKILLLYSYGHGGKGVGIFDDGFLSKIEAGGVSANDLYCEFLDLGRNQEDPEYRSRLAAALLRKYAHRQVDLIITIQQPALTFLLQEGQNLAPQAPTVTIQAPPPSAAAAGARQFLCQLAQFDIRGTLEQAFALFPQTRHLLIVAGNSEADRQMAAEASKLASPWQGKITLAETSTLTLTETRRKVATLPPHSLILFTQYNLDASGKATLAYEVEGMLTKVANAPVFGLYDFNLSNGGIGGSVVNVKGLGESTGQVALDLLAGKLHLTQPVTIANNQAEPIYDWRQIQRWGGDISHLPTATTFRNRPPSIWEQHQKLLIATLLLLTIQSGLIVALLLQRRQRQRAEVALRESEEQFRLLTQQAPIPVAIINEAQEVEYLNDRFTATFGYTQAELPTVEAWWPLAYPNDTYRQEVIGRWQELVATAIREGKDIASHEYQVTCKDGSVRTVEIFGSKIGNRQLILFSDITDRRQAEKRYRASEQRFRELLENVRLVAVILDREGRITFCNTFLLNLTGWSRAEVMGGNWFDLFLPAASRETVQTVFRAGIEKGELPTHFENPIVTRTGASRTIVWDNSILHHPDQAIAGIASIGIDVTAQRELENNLRQAQKMEAIGTLAGGIAHDFNNLLAAILGYTEMAMDDLPADPASAHSDLENVLHASLRAKDLVQQILAFSRQMEVERIPLQPAPLIKESLKLLRASLPATIEIRQDIDPQCGLILADSSQIHQILMNLCTNAFHAMEQSGGVLAITLGGRELKAGELPPDSGLTAGNYVELVVKDTGCGISPTIRDRIFEPYFTTKELGKGTGLGLAVVHGIIRSHGGLITVESEVGRGTAFHVLLPVIEPLLPELPAEDNLALPGQARILLVDDEELVLTMNSTLLRRLGYTVTSCQRSVEALALFCAQPDQFDLVITDQTMPLLTGADLARHLLALRPQLPIILCTGHSSLINGEQAKEIGIREFAFKPLSRHDLAQLVRRALE